MAVDDGTAVVTEAGKKADCVITADPVAFLLLGLRTHLAVVADRCAGSCGRRQKAVDGNEVRHAAGQPIVGST